METTEKEYFAKVTTEGFLEFDITYKDSSVLFLRFMSYINESLPQLTFKINNVSGSINSVKFYIDGQLYVEHVNNLCSYININT